MNTGVKVAIVVGQIHVGVLGRPGAVSRLTGNEAGNFQHVLGNASDGMHFFEICELGWSINAGNLYRGRHSQRPRRQTQSGQPNHN